jgi:hypothetical protein
MFKNIPKGVRGFRFGMARLAAIRSVFVENSADTLRQAAQQGA